MMLYEPAIGKDIARLAVPLTSGIVPMGVPPLLKVMDPVGTPVPALGATEAVSKTVWPVAVGFGVAVTLVVVAVWAAGVTVTGLLVAELVPSVMLMV